MIRNIGKKLWEYLFPKGSTYILGQKYWGSTFKLEISTGGVLLVGEYFWAVTPANCFQII